MRGTFIQKWGSLPHALESVSGLQEMNFGSCQADDYASDILWYIILHYSKYYGIYYSTNCNICYSMWYSIVYSIIRHNIIIYTIMLLPLISSVRLKPKVTVFLAPAPGGKQHIPKMVLSSHTQNTHVYQNPFLKQL